MGGQLPPRETVSRAGASVGVELSDQACRIIAAHLDMVMQARGSINLVSEKSAADAPRIHVADSLAAAPLLEGRESVVDIGSGAGYPGIPLAAALGADARLVESRRKRAFFLESVLEALGPMGLSGRVVNERAESNVAIREAGDADAVVVRAVASLPTLVELAAPFLRQGGTLVAFKGHIDKEELERGHRVAEMVGLGNPEIVSLELPGRGERRELVMYRRVGESAVELPRAEGRASKAPLA